MVSRANVVAPSSDEEAHRVRTDVDRADAHGSAVLGSSAGERAATQRPTGSSPPARYQAKWAWRHFTPVRVPPTPPAGLGPTWSGGYDGVALGRVTTVGRGQLLRIDRGLRRPHATGGLEPGDLHDQSGVDQPVARGHGRAVVEEWAVADHERFAAAIADDHLEGAARRSAEETGDGFAVRGPGRGQGLAAAGGHGRLSRRGACGARRSAAPAGPGCRSAPAASPARHRPRP